MLGDTIVCFPLYSRFLLISMYQNNDYIVIIKNHNSVDKFNCKICKSQYVRLRIFVTKLAITLTITEDTSRGKFPLPLNTKS